MLAQGVGWLNPRKPQSFLSGQFFPNPSPLSVFYPEPHCCIADFSILQTKALGKHPEISPFSKSFLIPPTSLSLDCPPGGAKNTTIQHGFRGQNKTQSLLEKQPLQPLFNPQASRALLQKSQNFPFREVPGRKSVPQKTKARQAFTLLMSQAAPTRKQGSQGLRRPSQGAGPQLSAPGSGRRSP